MRKHQHSRKPDGSIDWTGHPGYVQTSRELVTRQMIDDRQGPEVLRSICEDNPRFFRVLLRVEPDAPGYAYVLTFADIDKAMFDADDFALYMQGNPYGMSYPLARRDDLLGGSRTVTINPTPPQPTIAYGGGGSGGTGMVTVGRDWTAPTAESTPTVLEKMLDEMKQQIIQQVSDEMQRVMDEFVTRLGRQG